VTVEFAPFKFSYLPLAYLLKCEDVVQTVHLLYDLSNGPRSQQIEVVEFKLYFAASKGTEIDYM